MRKYYLLFIVSSIALIALLFSGYIFIVEIVLAYPEYKNSNNIILYIAQIVGILILMAAALISNYQPIEMPQEGQITVSSAIFLGATLLFSPWIAIIIAFFAFVLVFIVGGVNLKDLVFRFSKSVVCILAAGLAFGLFSGKILDINYKDNMFFQTDGWWNFLGILLAAGLYSALDTTLATLFVSTQEDINFRHVWEWHWSEILPYYLTLTPLGILIAISYNIKFPESSILIIAPLFLLERIHNSMKLQSLLGNVPEVVRTETNKEVEAVVVKTEQVRKEIEKKNRELEILLETGEDLGTSLELDKIFEIIKEKIQKIISCQTCIIFLVEEVEGEVQLVAKTVAGPYTEYVLTVKNFPISPNETIVGWVASERKYSFIADTEAQSTPPPMIRYERSEMAVPLVSKEECVGVIYVGQQKANSFTQDDLNLLITLANQAAFSITNAQLYQKTHNMAITDGLTGLFTHRIFQEKLQEEVQKAQRYKTCMSMIMVDTDHFKAYNDTYGHPDGDVLLKEICKLLKSYVRGTDIVCRYGGDEFTLILVEADKKTAINTAERIRQAIQLRLNQREVKITASIGVASYPEDATNKEELMGKADEALYKAKRGGRNRVCYPE